MRSDALAGRLDDGPRPGRRAGEIGTAGHGGPRRSRFGHQGIWCPAPLSLAEAEGKPDRPRARTVPARSPDRLAQAQARACRWSTPAIDRPPGCGRSVPTPAPVPPPSPAPQASPPQLAEPAETPTCSTGTAGTTRGPRQTHTPAGRRNERAGDQVPAPITIHGKWAPGSIRKNTIQPSHRKTRKFCNGLPVIGSAGLSLLQKSAAKVRTFAISFATERSHNPV